jgi:hypothetical protein
MALYRHGDLLVKDVEAIPDDARLAHHLVLAEGELTGHRLTCISGSTPSSLGRGLTRQKRRPSSVRSTHNSG